MKTTTKNIIMIVVALAVVAGMCIYPLITIKDSEFGGADGAAGELILEIDQSFEPWAEPLFPPPGGETESLLFCLQAALGSGVFCFCAGYLLAAKKLKKQLKAQENQ